MSRRARALNGLFLAATLSALTACASVVSAVYPLNTDATNVKPGNYTLDPIHTAVLFSVNHFGFSTYHGRFNSVSGTLDFDEETPENSRVSVIIKADSIDTNNETLENLLRAENMFNTAAYPDITFVSTRVTKTGQNTGIIIGDLTIAGVAQPFTLDVTFVGSGTNPASGIKTMGFEATGTLLRSDFGLKEWLPFVGDEVSLRIDAEFNPATK